MYRGKLDFDSGHVAKNEGITVVFPLQFGIGDPAYTIWQWTKASDGASKVNCFNNGFVNSLTVLEKSTKIGWCENELYSFSGTISKGSNGYRQISVTMHQNDYAGATTELHLVYESQPEHTVTPRIYIGKLTSLGSHADNELMVVVAPIGMGDGSPICAFWQWSEGDGNNSDAVTCISKQKNLDSIGESFTFYAGADSYYTFDCTVNDTTSQLTYTMSSPKPESTGLLTLGLQKLTTSKPLIPWGISSTSTVDNQTSDILICSLKNSGTDLVDNVLTSLSLVLGGAGVIAAAAGVTFTGPVGAAVTTAIGVFLADVGFYAAVGGAVHLWNNRGEETLMVMLPGDKFTRESSGSLSSDNDLRVMAIRVTGNRLVISTGIKENLGNNTWKLVGKMPGLSFKDLLVLNLPDKKRTMIGYRNIHIRGLKMYFQDISKSKDFTQMEDKEIPNTLVSYDKSAMKAYTWGTLDEYYATVKKAKPKNYFWTYDPNYGITFAQSSVRVTASSICAVVSSTPLGEDGTKFIIQFKNCNLEGGINYKDMGKYENAKEVMAKIEADVARNEANGWTQFFAYFWQYNESSQTGTLAGYMAQNSGTPDTSTRFTYSLNPNNSVFFVAPASSPTMCIVED